MATMIQVVCCNPACPNRIVGGEDVTREIWDASWLDGNPEHAPYWHSDIACPSCGQEGIDPESGQLDSAEEELGTRCAHCGVVSETEIYCPHCNWSKEPA